MEANAEKTMPTGILEKRIFTIGRSLFYTPAVSRPRRDRNDENFERTFILFLKIVTSRYLDSLQILALEEFDTSEVPI